MELNEREKNIVDLINNLSEVASDEATTQEAIDRILESIKQKTSENTCKGNEDLNQENDISDDMASALSEDRMSMMDGISSHLCNCHGHVTAPSRFAPLVFTRIREVKQPTKAHPTDAGIDFFVPDAKAWTDDFCKMVMEYSRNVVIDGKDGVWFEDGRLVVGANAHVAIPSGIKTIIPTGLAMMMVNKSGVATKLKLDHSACLIDSEYRDELIFCFFNHNVEPVKIEPGMKITQGLIVPVLNINLQEVLNCVYDDLGQDTDRGGGFGSSGSH
jgi:deoxyuridine 5'-triphosphate nucleotidohydrolase